MFFRKKEQPTPIKSDEYERVSKDFVGLIKEIDLLKIKLESLETTNRSLRAKINRLVLPEDSTQNENYNNSEFLPFG